MKDGVIKAMYIIRSVYVSRIVIYVISWLINLDTEDYILVGRIDTISRYSSLQWLFVQVTAQGIWTPGIHIFRYTLLSD